MAESVIEFLEVVEVEEENCEGLLFRPANCSSLSSASSRNRRLNSRVSGSRIDCSRRVSRDCRLAKDSATCEAALTASRWRESRKTLRQTGMTALHLEFEMQNTNRVALRDHRHTKALGG